MPWTCPACSLAIRHSEQEATPRSGVVYRCHICRLELILDVAANKLVLAPMRERSRF
jgi:predicted SprT family Zn-dependent metalloprotease